MKQTIRLKNLRYNCLIQYCCTIVMSIYLPFSSTQAETILPPPLIHVNPQFHFDTNYASISGKFFLLPDSLERIFGQNPNKEAEKGILYIDLEKTAFNSTGLEKLCLREGFRGYKPDHVTGFYSSAMWFSQESVPLLKAYYSILA